jgi:hypothetical protein
MGFAGGQVNEILPRGDEIMDESTTSLREKFERLMQDAAAAAVALSRADGTIQGVPHYSVIEGHAHQLGRQLSREIQARQMAEVAVERSPKAKCPTCGMVCQLVPRKHSVTSVDGPLELQELKGHCSRCRRDFFPSAGGVGA